MTTKRRHPVLGDDPQLREMATTCASLMAPLFRSQGWAWLDGVPDADRIAQHLIDLAGSLGSSRQEDRPAFMKRSGRLGVMKDDASPIGVSFFLELPVLW